MTNFPHTDLLRSQPSERSEREYPLICVIMSVFRCRIMTNVKQRLIKTRVWRLSSGAWGMNPHCSGGCKSCHQLQTGRAILRGVFRKTRRWNKGTLTRSLLYFPIKGFKLSELNAMMIVFFCVSRYRFNLIAKFRPQKLACQSHPREQPRGNPSHDLAPSTHSRTEIGFCWKQARFANRRLRREKHFAHRNYLLVCLRGLHLFNQHPTDGHTWEEANWRCCIAFAFGVTVSCNTCENSAAGSEFRYQCFGCGGVDEAGVTGKMILRSFARRRANQFRSWCWLGISKSKWTKNKLARLFWYFRS